MIGFLLRINARWHRISEIGFEKSALILAEAIKTMMEEGYSTFDGYTQKMPKAEDTLYLIYLAVKSDRAKNIWNLSDDAGCR